MARTKKQEYDFLDAQGTTFISPASKPSKHLPFIAFCFASFTVLWSILVSHDDVELFLGMGLMLLAMVAPQQ